MSIYAVSQRIGTETVFQEFDRAEDAEAVAGLLDHPVRWVAIVGGPEAEWSPSTERPGWRRVSYFEG